MTREEFQSYLNIVFVSLKDEAYGKDDKLPAKDKGLLLDVCKIVKYDEHNGKSAFDKAYKNNIEPVIKNWRKSMSQNQSSPYLLRQVLYYFCENAYTDGVKEYQQTELINKIGKVWYTKPKKGKNKGKKIPISQNVWNKWEMYPKKLYRVLFEEQPKRIYPYKGGKTDAIGLGVRYLAFQAGAFADFIDIFGGSGFASASVIHTQGTKYFYNELNHHVRNLFEVLADDALCKEYIRAMRDFLLDLNNQQRKSVFKDINLDTDGFDKYEKLKDKPIDCTMKAVKTYKYAGGTDYVYKVLGYWCYFQVLINSPKEIYEKEDKIKYAIASTYCYWAMVFGTDETSNSNIKYIWKYKTEGKLNTNTFLKYIGYEEDFQKYFKELESTIKKFHKAVKDVSVSGYDAIDLVRNYQDLLCLRYKDNPKRIDDIVFYSDSPYEGTSDYKNEANGVKSFTKDKMVSLIQALMYSKQKFIFSCRASVSQKGTKKSNKEIMKNVFEVFKVFAEKTSNSLYVTAALARLKKDKNNTYKKEELIQRFADSVRDNEGTEIYITNYKVRDFYSEQFNTDYPVMDFGTFMKIEKENLQV
ncbi:MAG: hypothetical protein J6O73_11305 [Lachnospiraceae bacterium]|nr:hypothetical protein [Lachnospiraceae bacterium]